MKSRLKSRARPHARLWSQTVQSADIGHDEPILWKCALVLPPWDCSEVLKQQQQLKKKRKKEHNHDPLPHANAIQQQCALKCESRTPKSIVYWEDTSDLTYTVTAPSFESDIPLLSSLCCHHSQTNLRKLLCILLKPARGRRQFLSNARTLSQKPNCSCQNIVCALDAGVGTYSLSCYTLHKHPCSEWVTNCVPSSPFSARQPCAVPALLSDIGYLIGELTAPASL